MTLTMVIDVLSMAWILPASHLKLPWANWIQLDHAGSINTKALDFLGELAGMPKFPTLFGTENDSNTMGRLVFINGNSKNPKMELPTIEKRPKRYGSGDMAFLVQ